jgi:FixJ family two-component response regulator
MTIDPNGRSGRRPLVVVVDDDDGCREALGRLLQIEGFETAVFDSAEAFLEATLAATPLCVVLDLHLPGLSGLQLQERLRNQPRSPAVIIVTARGDSPERARAERNGCAAFFQKPVSSETLVGFIRVLANRSGS